MNYSLYIYLKRFLGLMILFMAVLPAYGGQINSVEFKLINLINQERDKPFLVNDLLCRVAQNHAEQLFVSEFVTGEAIDENRRFDIETSGYFAVASGELNAMVVFTNYLASDAAARILFESLKKQSVGLDESSALFSSQFLEMGIHVFETSLFYGRSRFNVYLAVVNYAQPVQGDTETDLMEARLLNLINQARTFPNEVLDSYELSVEGIDLTGFLAPLRFSPEIEPVVDSQEYTLISETGNPADAVEKLFLEILLDSAVFQTGSDLLVNKGVLDPVAKGIDIRIIKELLEAEEGLYQAVYTTTIGFVNVDLPSESSTIEGLFYSDTNANGLYNAGEELPLTPMVVYDAGIHSQTGLAGEISEVVNDADKGNRIILFPVDRGLVIQEIDKLNKVFVLINAGLTLYP